ncbi:hypothetical protein MSC49_16500 [Methylosinus sp. C49]|uniref:ABC transporter substrate-binding protein n=1 Tax=Methylosinus sp. C49 TaxID=2699395 RepID=UPI0013677F87|nr:ABC transporter substrate-binding protein [Methylosinus sp. C49]BBU61715.1 hypothetical protein MSC49_16500 [Methylosinus sp. C49]
MIDRRYFSRAVVASALTLPGVARSEASVLRLGTMRLNSAAPFFVASDKGFFEGEGLKVQIEYFDAAAQLPVAAVANSIDVGMTAFTAAYFNLAAKGGLKLVCGDSRPHPAFPNNQLVASRNGYDAGLRSFADIRGRRLGITTIGSSFHYQFGVIAAKFAFPLSQVELIPLQTLPNVGSAIAAGKLDGAILPSTVADPLVRAGSGVFIGNTAEVDMTQGSGVFTRPDFIAANRTGMERFVRAHRRAMAFSNKAVNRLDEQGRPIASDEREDLLEIVARRTGQTRQQISSTFGYYDPAASLNVEDVRKVLRFWQDQGLVKREVDAEHVIDLSFAA